MMSLYGLCSAETLQALRLLQGVSYACATLMFYDFLLTFSDEVKRIWSKAKFSPTMIAYFLSRYCGAAMASIILLPQSRASSVVFIALMQATVMASNAVFALRTWALWLHSRNIGVALVLLAIVSFGPAFISLAVEMWSTTPLYFIGIQTAASGPRGCFQETVGGRFPSPSVMGFIPLGLCILFNTVNILLMSIASFRWWKSVPASVRSPVMGSIMKDGLLYYGLMLGSSMITIYFLRQHQLSDIRPAAAQVQIFMHSVVTTRLVRHLAGTEWQGNTMHDIAISRLRFASTEHSARTVPTQV